MNSTELKLKYLAELRQMFEAVKAPGIQGNVANRMQQLCDSIERDLLDGTPTCTPVGILHASTPVKRIDLSTNDESTVYSHQCIDCGQMVSGVKPKITDGLSCPKCNGTIVPKSSLTK